MESYGKYGWICHKSSYTSTEEALQQHYHFEYDGVKKLKIFKKVRVHLSVSAANTGLL